MKVKSVVIEVILDVDDLPNKALDLLDALDGAGDDAPILEELTRMGYKVEMEYGEVIEVSRMLEMIRPTM